MGGRGEASRPLRKKAPARRKNKPSFPSLQDIQKEEQREVLARVAARKAAAAQCRQQNLERRLAQPDEERTPSPATQHVVPLPPVPGEAKKQSAEEEKARRLARMIKVRAEMNAKSRSAAAAARKDGTVLGTGAPSTWTIEGGGVRTQIVTHSAAELRANDPGFQGWMKQR